MTFVCQRCGDCCSTMGEIISIREQIGPCEFRIGYTNGEERTVTVDPDKRELFCAQKPSGKLPAACPFLRVRGLRERICTVHASRPELCRGYSCYRILVLHPDGSIAGRVPAGSRSFIPGDPTLFDLWCNEIRNSMIPDEEHWEAYVENMFTRAGYRIIR